jgi:hypothetical protein
VNKSLRKSCTAFVCTAAQKYFLDLWRPLSCYPRRPEERRAERGDGDKKTGVDREEDQRQPREARAHKGTGHPDAHVTDYCIRAPGAERIVVHRF